MSEAVIELSIEETNQLRQQLGLRPLRIANLNHQDGISSMNTGSAGAGTGSNIIASESESASCDEPPIINTSHSNKEFLELSVSETNQLRQQLGLAPLKMDIGNRNGSSKSTGTTVSSTEGMTATSNSKENHNHAIQHAPAVNEGERHEVAERIARARLKRQVETNIQTLFATPSLGVTDFTDGQKGSDTEPTPTKSWAQRMRASGTGGTAATTTSAATKQSSSNNNKNTNNSAAYQEHDLHGLHVGHSISELEDGSTTILTLTDAPLLQTDDSDITRKIIGLNDTTDVELQNVQLVQQQQIQDGLREKRKLELGLGRSGGYVGYDDDEFEELGGTQGPSRLSRTNHHTTTNSGMNGTSAIIIAAAAAAAAPPLNTTKTKRKKGFHIGNMLEEQDADTESDIITTMQNGKAISLVQTTTATNADSTQSDYMTTEEYNAIEDEQKRMKKSNKLKNRNKLLDKKDKKKHKRRTSGYDSDDDDPNNIEIKGTKKGSLLDELDSTAVGRPTKRNRKNDNTDDDNVDGNASNVGCIERDDDNTTNVNPTTNSSSSSTTINNITTTESLQSKRARYEQVMAKGNERSQNIFATSTTATNTKNAASSSSSSNIVDEEPDDAFLNAALEKARRLNRLKALASSNQQQQASTTKGAEAVVAAIQQANTTTTANNHNATDSRNPTMGRNTNEKTITFTVDETREFTRTLLARTEQIDREQARIKKRNTTMIKMEPKVDEYHQISSNNIDHSSTTMINDENTNNNSNDNTNYVTAVKEENPDMDVDINELAKEVLVDDNNQEEQHHIGLDGTTTVVPKIGRGVGGLLQLLQQQSGGMQQHRPNEKKEEMRGRAKDKRTYEDYEPLDLSKVVRIDERNATDKDKELASREVKLEYRDEHGRLLTRKEAFRDLSYQFHGYGSGKRKQEKKLEQIAREQAEARIVSQQLEGSVNTTFGALKETQRATGKAFVVHKTGM